MKESFLKCMLAAFVCCGHANAQKVLLPYGQFTQQPWAASVYFSKSGETGPADDWFAKDFDESAWNSAEGPISTAEGALSYYNTIWEAEYGTYWVRRHFTVHQLSEIRDVFFYVSHDDRCVAYLNGTQIYNYNYDGFRSNEVVNFDEAARKLLIEGDNVLAIRVSDNGGLYACVDNGLYGYSLINGTFNSTKGWTGSYDRRTVNGNTIAYQYGRNWSCQQTLTEMPAGLYRLSANACGMEYYNDFNTAWANRNDEIPAKLFINSDEISIPSAFTEMTDYDYGYCWEINGKYVPYNIYNTPTVLNNMYKCELWSFYDPDESDIMTIGIHNKASNDINRWAVWDNLDITYYTEAEVASMLDSIVTIITDLNSKNQNKDVKNQTSTLIAKAKAATEYIDKSHVFADIKYHEAIVRKSIEAYEKLIETNKALENKLKEISNQTSPATISEAIKLNAEVLSAYESGTYDNENVAEAIDKMNRIMTRLGYTYLDITVTVPGSMGDSILNKVENFVDVQSIKISGTLNDADINTIQARLSQLREIDMTNVNMTSLANRFFYQRSLLEIVKLPANLTTIGEYAFYQCYGIRHIDFPSALTTINRYAFQDCDNLQEVILPEGLTTLGEGAFCYCDNNKYLKFPSTLKAIGSSAFYYNINLKTIDFTEGLTHINNYAFYECYTLNGLAFPSSLYFIGNNAFAYNRSLSSVEFNEGLFQIEDNAFYDCAALKEITLPSSLVLANASPFDYCDNLRKVTCLSVEPPYMTDQIPYGLSMEGRELYVPALSINVYKQTAGWDKFPTIKPIDYLPENFTVLGDLHLTLPETIPADYKPNVSVIHDQKNMWYYQYGSLTVNGEGTLSMNNFAMVWDPNYQYDYYDRNQNYCTLINNSHLRSDGVSIELYTRNDRWSFISFPFDVKVSDIETISEGTTNWVIRRYDGQKRAAGETSETWVKMTGDDILNAGEGYIIQGSRYVNNSWQNYSGFRMKAINNGNKNNIFNTGNAVVTLSDYPSEFTHNRSWNLIGNPYPSYYDTRYMDFSAPITVWNINYNTYTAYSPSDDSYILCPGEAFFVQCPVDNNTIVFDKDGRQTTRDARTIEAPSRSNAFGKTERSIINLCISDGNNTDRTRIVLNENSSMQYEMDKDASKFMSTDMAVPQIYTSGNGVKYAINERPVADGTANLCIYIGTDGFYSISLANNVDRYQVVLEDKAENKSVVLNGENEYVFSAKTGLYDARFILHFIDETTYIDDISSTSDDNGAFYSIDGIRVTTPIQKGVYIQNGKKVIINK